MSELNRMNRCHAMPCHVLGKVVTVTNLTVLPQKNRCRCRQYQRACLPLTASTCPHSLNESLAFGP